MLIMHEMAAHHRCGFMIHKLNNTHAFGVTSVFFIDNFTSIVIYILIHSVRFINTRKTNGDTFIIYKVYSMKIRIGNIRSIKVYK